MREKKWGREKREERKRKSNEKRKKEEVTDHVKIIEISFRRNGRSDDPPPFPPPSPPPKRYARISKQTMLNVVYVLTM